MVMFLVAAALVSAWLITVADMPSQMVSLLEPVMGSPILLMLTILVLIILIGMAMDQAPIILILVPVLLPVVKQAGIDPIYFGVMFVMITALGLITPPVGTVLNVVAGVSKIDIISIVKGLWPFLLAELLVVLMLVLFPELVIVPGEWFAR